MEWWEEETRKGEDIQVLSAVEYLRRLRLGEGLGSSVVYVVGLDRLLQLSRDKEAAGTWMRAILIDGRQRVKGRAVRVVVEDLRETVGQGIEVVLSDGKRTVSFPLQLIFGSVSMKTGGWAFATYTVS